MQDNMQERLRFKRQLPKAQFFTLEAMVLSHTHDLVEAIQELKLAIQERTPHEESIRRCNNINLDIDNVREPLRDMKA